MEHRRSCSTVFRIAHRGGHDDRCGEMLDRVNSEHTQNRGDEALVAALADNNGKPGGIVDGGPVALLLSQTHRRPAHTARGRDGSLRASSSPRLRPSMVIRPRRRPVRTHVPANFALRLIEQIGEMMLREASLADPLRCCAAEPRYLSRALWPPSICGLIGQRRTRLSFTKRTA
jgi:hypothetical protein